MIPREGTLVADRYRLERKVGGGRVAAVWRVQDEVTEGRCVVKLLHRSMHKHAEALTRFSLEERLARELHGPYFAERVGSGSWDSMRYIAWRWYEGESLRALFERNPKQDAPTVHSIVQETCQALSLVHAAGYTHGDIKPENLFFAERSEQEAPRQLKLLGFGVAARLAQVSPAHQGRRKGTLFVGTPLYTSPELILGRTPRGGQADLWALAVIAYEALTGRPPFIGADLPALLEAILERRAPRPSTLADHIPASFDLWWAQALEQEFQTPNELANALTRALAPALRSSRTQRSAALPAAGLAELGSVRPAAPTARPGDTAPVLPTPQAPASAPPPNTAPMGAAHDAGEDLARGAGSAANAAKAGGAASPSSPAAKPTASSAPSAEKSGVTGDAAAAKPGLATLVSPGAGEGARRTAGGPAQQRPSGGGSAARAASAAAPAARISEASGAALPSAAPKPAAPSASPRAAEPRRATQVAEPSAAEKAASATGAAAKAAEANASPQPGEARPSPTAEPRVASGGLTSEKRAAVPRASSSPPRAAAPASSPKSAGRGRRGTPLPGKRSPGSITAAGLGPSDPNAPRPTGAVASPAASDIRAAGAFAPLPSPLRDLNASFGRKTLVGITPPVPVPPPAASTAAAGKEPPAPLVRAIEGAPCRSIDVTSDEWAPDELSFGLEEGVRRPANPTVPFPRPRVAPRLATALDPEEAPDTLPAPTARNPNGGWKSSTTRTIRFVLTSADHKPQRIAALVVCSAAALVIFLVGRSPVGGTGSGIGQATGALSTEPATSEHAAPVTADPAAHPERAAGAPDPAEVAVTGGAEPQPVAADAPGHLEPAPSPSGASSPSAVEPPIGESPSPAGVTAPAPASSGPTLPAAGRTDPNGSTSSAVPPRGTLKKTDPASQRPPSPEFDFGI